MRVRRFAAAAIAAVLGVGSLAACGTGSPDVAAYVGDTTYRMSRVDAVYDEVQQSHGDRVRQAYAAENDAAKQRAEETGAEVPAAVEPSPQDLLAPVTRQDVVNLLVTVDLGRELLADRQLTAPADTDPAAVANGLGVHPDTEYAALWTESYGIYRALAQDLSPAADTDENILAFYTPLADLGALPPGLTAAQVREGLGGPELAQMVIAVRDAYAGKADEVGVTVNPRFGAVAVPMVLSGGQGDIFFDLPYTGGTVPVTDAPATTEPVGDADTDGHAH